MFYVNDENRLEFDWFYSDPDQPFFIINYQSFQFSKKEFDTDKLSINQLNQFHKI